jgi:hypothetical protein
MHMNFAYFLVVEEGPMVGESIELQNGRKTIVGRQEGIDFQIQDVNISRQHAAVTLKGNVVVVEDLGSQNGVFLDGKRISEAAEVTPSTKITMAQNVFVVRLEQVESVWVRTMKQKVITLKGLPNHHSARVRYPALFIEAAVFTGLALLIVAGLGIREAGFFGLFLSAASLIARFEHILSENKHDIFVLNLRASTANLRTAKSILMLFLGICAAYFVMALTYTEHDLAQYFTFIFDNVSSRNDNIFNRDFSNFQGILRHNVMVSLIIMVLCCLYRSYAALLALGWNAATWVLVLVSFTRRVLEVDVLNPVQISSMVFVAVTPHLILEGSAYVLVALAAIWYSRGVTKYALTLSAPQPISEASFAALKRPQEQILADITKSCFKMVLLGVAILLLAALVEALYAPWMLEQIQASIQR